MISRETNQRFVTVRMNLRGRDLSSFVKEAESKIEEQVKYDHTQFKFHWAGQLENQHRAFSRLAVVVPITLAVMFLLLFFTFGKFRQAGLLIGMLPLAVFGGMLALVLRGMTFNVSSAVGFIALWGLHPKRCDHDFTYQRAAKTWYGAEGGGYLGASHRLRPVLMTATVAVLGLLPASLSTGIGSDVQRPLATVLCTDCCAEQF